MQHTSVRFDHCPRLRLAALPVRQTRAEISGQFVKTLHDLAMIDHVAVRRRDRAGYVQRGAAQAKCRHTLLHKRIHSSPPPAAVAHAWSSATINVPACPEMSLPANAPA